MNIVEQDPENWRAFNNMGILSWTQQAWNDAYTMFLKSASLCPDYTDALVNLFDAALKLRKIEEIRPVFDEAVTLNPENDEIRVLRESILEEGAGIYQSKRALTIGCYHPMIEEAKKEMESGNLYKAMELFLQVNDKDGPNADAFCGLGIISFYQERYDDAFVLFTESLKINPTATDTFLNLIDAAKASNRMKEARDLFSAFRKEFEELSVLDECFVQEEKKD